MATFMKTHLGSSALTEALGRRPMEVPRGPQSRDGSAAWPHRPRAPIAPCAGPGARPSPAHQVTQGCLGFRLGVSRARPQQHTCYCFSSAKSLRCRLRTSFNHAPPPVASPPPLEHFPAASRYVASPNPAFHRGRALKPTAPPRVVVAAETAAAEARRWAEPQPRPDGSAAALAFRHA